ncbi:hypothetical protein J6590_079646 [Homalodisca vitripennis]|nr:hypothetical protein J6590_079646 [Homalodisca vitripennis]
MSKDKRSEREKKGLNSKRTVRRVSQLGSGSPGVASLTEERGGLPCSRMQSTLEELNLGLVSLRKFRDTLRVLRYAPVEKKEEMTPMWGRRKEKVGEICPEKIKDVER